MDRTGLLSTETLRILPRAALLAAALIAPLMLIPSVQAGAPRTVIEDDRAPTSGAGFVLLMSLRRL